MTEQRVDWTAERTDLLKRMWREGASASEIAAAVGGGCTRNAAIGKVHRMKLPGRRKIASAPKNRNRVPSPSMSQKPAIDRGVTSPVAVKRPSNGEGQMKALTIAHHLGHPAPDILPDRVTIDIPVKQRLTLLQLNDHVCRYPVGDPRQPEFYFCGGHAAKPSIYCAFHTARAYNAVGKKAA